MTFPPTPPTSTPLRLTRTAAAVGLLGLLGLLGLAAVASPGCAGSASAVRYDPANDRVYDPSLVGTWRGERDGTPTEWRLRRADDFSYALRVDAGAGDAGPPAIPVDLVEVGDRAYLFPRGGDDVRAAASTVLIRLDRTGPGEVRASMLDTAHLADVLAADGRTVASADSPSAGDVTPPEPPSLSLRKQLLARADDPDLFVPVAELRKVE